MNNKINKLIAREVMNLPGIVELNQYLWYNNGINDPVPDYANDLNATILIANKLAEKDYEFSVDMEHSDIIGNYFSVCFLKYTSEHDFESYWFHHKSLSLAICGAALKVLDINTKDLIEEIDQEKLYQDEMKKTMEEIFKEEQDKK